MSAHHPSKLRDYIDHTQTDAVEALLREATSTESAPKDPIALRILVGIGSWFSSLFLLGFLAIGFQPSEGGAVALGAFIIGFMLILHYRAENKAVFVDQGILACITAGHLLILVGAAELFGRHSSPLHYALIQSLLCLIGVLAYKQSLYRISSLLLTVVLWIHTALELEIPLLYHLLLSIQVIAFALLALWRTRSSSYLTALALSLLCSIFYLDWIQSSHWQAPLQSALWVANLWFIALLAATIWRIHPNAWHHPLRCLLALGVLSVLAWGSTPGILLGLCLILYGRGVHNRILEALGISGLFAGVAFYYYSLQTSLLLKSGNMFLSGLVCLGLALYFHRTQTRQKEAVQS